MGLAAELLSLLSSPPKASPSFPLSALDSSSALLALILSRTVYLLTSRPTAVNLLEALTRIEGEGNKAVQEGCSALELAKRVVHVAVGVWSEDRERNHRIGDNGAAWILERLEREGSIQKGEKISVLTVSAGILPKTKLHVLIVCSGRDRSVTPARLRPRCVSNFVQSFPSPSAMRL